MTGNAGIGLTDLGLTGLADGCLDTAARLTAGETFVHSLYVARQAKSALRARDPELTAARMITLATLAPLVDSPRLSIHLRHIYDGSRVWDPIPAVRAARAGLREAMPVSREPDRDDDFERYIQELVASAPPLTEETRRKLAALLDPSTSEP